MKIQFSQRVLNTVFIFSLLFSSFIYSQDTTAKKRHDYQLRVIPLPVIASNPTNGWMFGVAPGATWMMGDTATTSLSSMLGTLIYTTNKQWINTFKATTFLSGDKFILMTDMRYFISSQPTYGLGTGPSTAKLVNNGFAQEASDKPYNSISTAQMMEFSYIRFHQTLLIRHKNTRLFYGLGYHLDYHYEIDDHLLALDTVPQTVTSHYGYSIYKGFDPQEYLLSGVSLNVCYDSRDNTVNPYSGRYAFANIRLNPEAIGSDKNSTLLWLEYRDYLHLSKKRPRHLIGFWTYAWLVTSGQVPYMDLPAVGWDQFGRSGRAYTQGRFRGQELMYGEIEYRFPLQRKKEMFGGVVFFNKTNSTNHPAGIYMLKYIFHADGLGLRVMISKKSRANLNIDYAWGKYGAQGFYLGLNEAF